MRPRVAVVGIWGIRAGDPGHTWAEHLLPHERLTQGDMALWKAVQGLHLGPHPVPTRHFLSLREPLFTGDATSQQELAPVAVKSTKRPAA